MTVAPVGLEPRGLSGMSNTTSVTKSRYFGPHNVCPAGPARYDVAVEGIGTVLCRLQHETARAAAVRLSSATDIQTELLLVRASLGGAEE